MSMVGADGWDRLRSEGPRGRVKVVIQFNRCPCPALLPPVGRHTQDIGREQLSEAVIGWVGPGAGRQPDRVGEQRGQP